MSKQDDKDKRTTRLHADDTAIRKQVKIAKEYKHMNSEFNPKLDQPHRFAKHHAMDCGNPKCIMCASPRKIYKEPTIQEKSFQQTENWNKE